jgi:sugar/nucleoside kinase (ribokinase family)
MDVVGVGENSVDLVYRLPAAPAANGKQAITSHRRSAGGQVATTLCACASLGLRTAYVGAFGDDDHGRIARGALVERGVYLTFAPVRPAPNRYAVILVNEQDGSRSVLHQRDPRLTLRPEELPQALIAGARVVHVDAVDPDASLAAARLGRAADAIVTVDIDEATEPARALIDAATHPILAEHVPASLTGEQDLERSLRALRQPHHAMVCVTLGSRGSAMLVGDELVTAPAFPVTAIDTTSAGDVFRGAFIYALLRGDAPADILRFANAAAAVSCTREGAIDSVPSPDDVQLLAARRRPA